MKKFILAAVVALFSISTYGQSDSIYMHNGTIISGKVKKITEHTIVFTYDNEDAEQTYGKYAVGKVVYGKSGRVQELTKKITVRSKEDWEDVIVLENSDDVAGLRRGDDVRGKTAFINLRTGGGSDRKALEYLKKDAADQGCPFVLITSDKDIDRKGFEGGSLGQIQSIKKGIAYKY